MASLVRRAEDPGRFTWSLPPWTAPVDEIIVVAEREKALKQAQRLPLKSTVFVDGAVREGLCSIGVVYMEKASQPVTILQETVARAKSFSVLATELLAILAGLEHLATRQRGRREAYLATDSQKALEAIRTGARRLEGQYIVQRIYEVVDEIAARGLTLWLIWVPAHAGVKGNEAADRAAKEVVTPDQKPNRDPRHRRRLVKTVTRTLLQSIQEEEKKRAEERKRYGMYTWKLDGAAPGRHTISLYNALDAEQAAILIQCRSNHSHLRSYLHRIGREESGECECGTGQETVKHVLLACPRWQGLRQELVVEAGARWGDISFLLGGWSGWEDRRTGKPADGPKDKWKPNLAAVKATIQFLQRTGRFSDNYKEVDTSNPPREV